MNILLKELEEIHIFMDGIVLLSLTIWSHHWVMRNSVVIVTVIYPTYEY